MGSSNHPFSERPKGDVVFFERVMISIKRASGRPSRSSFHTTSVSPDFTKLSASFNPGQPSRDPEALSSNKCRESAPAPSRASFCKSVHLFELCECFASFRNPIPLHSVQSFRSLRTTGIGRSLPPK